MRKANWIKYLRGQKVEWIHIRTSTGYTALCPYEQKTLASGCASRRTYGESLSIPVGQPAGQLPK
jgi:hypothetical protein